MVTPVREAALRPIGGIAVLGTRTEDLIALLAERRHQGRATELMFANTNFVVSCHRLATGLSGPETLIVNDGIGLDLASRLLHGKPFPENLNGTDFTPRLLRSLGAPTRVFLLGARAPVVARTAIELAKLPNVEVVGAVDGYEGMDDPSSVIDALRSTAPDLLLVALGDPRQAEWMLAHRGRHGVPLVIGVGALFDFVSGDVARAPRWVRRLRLEWMFRLMLEPRRLMRRYSIDLIAFFAHCLRTQRAERRAARTGPGRTA